MKGQWWFWRTKWEKQQAGNVTDHFIDFIGFYMLTPGPSPSENSS
jgi:hypothetical protein